MKEVFQVINEELKKLEKNVEFLEEFAQEQHLLVVKEILFTIELLRDEIGIALLKLAYYKNSKFDARNYREREIDLDFIDERIAVLNHLDKMKIKLSNEHYEEYAEAAKKLSVKNEQLMVKDLSKRYYPKLDSLINRCKKIELILEQSKIN